MSLSATSEYMKIRRYVMNLIHLSRGEAVQIPTVQELCSQFNVSRPTVCRAMKALTQDGYVTAKRGIGSFTNPDKCRQLYNPIQKIKPVVGLIYGDGMIVHYSSYTALCLSSLIKHLSLVPSTVHLLTLTSSDPEQIYQDIKNERLDALFWNAPEGKQLEVCKRLQDENFPLVIGQKNIDNCSCISFDFEDAGYQCGKILIDEGRRNVIFFPNRYPQSEECNGLKRAYHEAGIPLNENLFLDDFTSVHEKICEIISYGIPVDAIYGLFMSYNELEDYLLHFDPEIYKRCAVVVSGVPTPSANPFHRLEYEIPFEEFGQESAHLIKKAIEGDHQVKHNCLNIAIKTT